MLILLLIGALSLLPLFLVMHRKNEQFNPPPGPKGIPFIGNLHKFNPSTTHLYLAKLAKIYGPIFSLQFGFRSVVVIDSAKLAKEVLHAQDKIFYNRFLKVGPKRLTYNALNVGYAPYGEYFCEMKKTYLTHLLSSRRMQSFAHINHELISRLIRRISSLSSSSKVIDLSELLTIFGTCHISRIAFGKSFEDDEGSTKRYNKLLHETEALFTHFFYTDYFPIFGKLLDKLTGQLSRLEKTFEECDVFYENIIDEHIDSFESKSEQQEDLINVLLQLKKDNFFSFELSLDHIKAVLVDVILGGSNPSPAMTIWAMTELIKNPISMKKIQEELRMITLQNKNYIIEDDLQNLEYFKAVVKETFRLHPAAPLLPMQETLGKTTIEGYDIQSKTLVFINLWNILRDPKCWKNPEMFIPEKFIGNSINYNGRYFEFIPFGAGRRMCPGMQLGVTSFELLLANLLYYFNWEMPPNLKVEDIDTEVLQGITMHKKTPLCLMVKSFS